ncbi:TauD/TfdA family dioxygenase [Nocardia sp. NPDC005366]|uniref:TauD/TfdA family dioxygenase n=1 Tax=Nocardia sp. NPDC005366 TaxID=3156878 RepID=UPI0033B18F65
MRNSRGPASSILIREFTMGRSFLPALRVDNRVEVHEAIAQMLVAQRETLPPPHLEGGLLRRDVVQAYSNLDIPGVGELRRAATQFLTDVDSNGFLVIRARALLDVTEDEDTATDLLTVLLTHIGTPLRVFDKWPLWKPITSRLDVDPMRAFGVGYNPMHLDLVNATEPPDISGLFCIQPDPFGEGYSLVSNVRHALADLDDADRKHLAKPVFRDGVFFDVSGIGAEYDPFPIVDGLPPSEGYIRFTAKMLGERDPDDPATLAALRLGHRLTARQQRFRLERGDLLLINQHLACHGREPLGPGQETIPESQRRVLRQIFIRNQQQTTVSR